MHKTRSSEGYTAPVSEEIRLYGKGVICTSMEKDFEEQQMEEYSFDGSEYEW